MSSAAAGNNLKLLEVERSIEKLTYKKEENCEKMQKVLTDLLVKMDELRKESTAGFIIESLSTLFKDILATVSYTTWHQNSYSNLY